MARPSRFIIIVLIISLIAPATILVLGDSNSQPEVQRGISTGTAPLHPNVKAVHEIPLEHILYIDENRTYSIRYGDWSKSYDTNASFFLVIRKTSTFDIIEEKAISDSYPLSSFVHGYGYPDELIDFLDSIFIQGVGFLHLSGDDGIIYLINQTTLETDWTLDTHKNEIEYFNALIGGRGDGTLRYTNDDVIILASAEERDVFSVWKRIMAVNIRNGSIIWQIDVEDQDLKAYKGGIFDVEDDIIFLNACPGWAYSGCDFRMFSTNDGKYLGKIGFQEVWSNWPGWENNSQRFETDGYRLESIEVHDGTILAFLINP